jgi:hypothetical protein
MPIKQKSQEITKYLLSLFFFLPLLVHSQNQPGIPKPSGPVDLNDTSDLVIYIIIPAIILILFLVFRKRIFKIKEEKQERLQKDREEKGN